MIFEFAVVMLEAMSAMSAVHPPELYVYVFWAKIFAENKMNAAKIIFFTVNKISFFYGFTLQQEKNGSNFRYV